MALLTPEIARIRAELGYNVMDVGAEPYIDYTAVFETVIKSNVLSSGSSTTSTTDVTASGTPATVALTLADATGFDAGERVVVDVDDRQEIATIQSVSGSVIRVQLTNAHDNPYPVTVEGGETIVREALQRIRETKAQMATVYGTGALKQVDEIQWYQSRKTQFGELGSQLMFWRDELAAALGVPNAWRTKRGASQSLSMY